MHLFRHSSAEGRLLNAFIDPNQVKKVSTRGQVVNTAPTTTTYTNPTTAGSANYNIPLTGSSTYGTPKVTQPIVPAGYNINTDPTYSGTIGPDTGWTGQVQTSGNVGPSAGQSWSGGMSGGSFNSPWVSIADQAQAAYDSAYNSVGPYASIEAKIAAGQGAKANFLMQQQTDMANQQMQSNRQKDAMNVSAGAADQNKAETTDTPTAPTIPTAQTVPANSAAAFAAKNLKKRLGQIPDKQTYIEQRRAEGATDQQIRDELASMPPPTAPPPIQTPPPDAGTNGAGGTTQDGMDTKTGATDPKKDGKPEAPPTPTAPPVALSIGQQMYNIGVANGDPMAGITLALYNDQIQREAEAKANAALSLGASLNQATQDNTDAQSFIDKWAGISMANTDKLTKLLQTQNESTNKYLETQKANDLAKLNFDRDVQTQQLERAKTKDILKSSISMALAGGSYSGAGQEALADAERQWDTSIQNLAKEFSFKAADVSSFYTQKYVDAKNQLNLQLFEASSELDAKLEGYAGQGFNSLKAMQNAKANAKNAYRTQIDTITKDHATFISGLVKEMGTRIEKNRDNKRAEDKEAYDRSWDEFKFKQDQLYRYDSLEQTKLLREDALDTKRDDKEKYNAELVRGKIQSQMEGNMVFDQYKQARMSWQSLETAFNTKNNPFRDRAMAKSYEKLVEVGSVVMPGEYADITSNVPLMSKISGKLAQVRDGGQSWTDDERKALHDLSKELYGAYENRRNEEAHIFQSAIQFHNRNTSNPSYQLSPDMFNLPTATSTQQVDGFQKLLPAGYQSPFSSPQGATDSSGLQSGTFDGRKVTLAAPAFNAFKQANEAFRRDHGADIRIGAVALSSYRNQSDAIKSMAQRVGVPFNAANPSVTAAALREMGHPVADIGGSKHEKGLAIDLYPGDITIGGKKMKAYEYISLVKPYLERYGLRQENHQGNDPGNFEYSQIS